MNGMGALEAALRDVRFAGRMLLRNPGFAAAAILCLGLGIGATTAIFSVVSAVLLRPLPYAHADRLVRLYTANLHATDAHAEKFGFSGPEWLAIQKQTQSLDAVESWVIGGANITGGMEPLRPTVAYVSGGLLEMLGVSPVRGRLLTRQDDLPTAPQTAVISYGLWHRVFGGDSGVVGRDVQFSGRKCTIVGVMPPGFQFPPGEAEAPDVWSTLQIDPARPGSPYNHPYSVMGRLRPGVTLAQGRRELDALVRRIEAETRGAIHLGMGRMMHYVAPYSFQEEIVGSARTPLLVLLGAVVFVLLIACVNVANLLLARAETRRREIAIRKVVGAGLLMLVRQFIAEGLMLAMAGAAVGLALAFGGVRLLTASHAGNIPRLEEIGINWMVLAFTLALSLATGIAFGMAPAAQLGARNLHDTLKSATARSTATVASMRFRQLLVVGELGLALVLLIGTGLMIRAFWKLQQVEIGVNSHNVLTMNMTLPSAVYPKPERALQFWTDLQRRVSTLPGVVSATTMMGLPPQRPAVSNTTPVEGYLSAAGRNSLEIDFFQAAGPRFFETMGVHLLEGRVFDERDASGAARVAIVNQTLARTLWSHESALGHRLAPQGPPAWHTIVGVVADVKNAGVDQPTGTELFLPYQQAYSYGLRSGYLAVRTRPEPASLTAAVRKEVRALDPSLPISKVRELDDVIAGVESQPRLLTMLLTTFAAVALALASIGIYGVISYSVAQRTNEFGIRIAMGAGSMQVLRIVMRQGIVMGLSGLALGAAGAFWLTRFLTGVLFGISSVDPWTFAAMVGLLGAVTLTACYVPARRATKVDPIIALRWE